MNHLATNAADEAPARIHFANRLTELVDEADRLLHTIAIKGDHEYDVARDRIVEQMERARRELAQFNDTLMYRARTAARRGDRAVHEHPYAAIGAAAGIGLMLGWILRRH